MTLHRALLLVALTLVGTLSGTPANALWLQREAAIMGTRCAVELWSDSRAKGEAAISAVLAEMRAVDTMMSTYKPTSQISRVNARAALEPVQVGPELFSVIQRSLEFSALTRGAFDITYASVGYLYDYRKHVRPDEAHIEAALPGVDWHHLELDAVHHTVKFQRSGMRIDLGGIAKGYAVDRGIEILRKLGIKHAAVTAGGDSRVLGDRRGRPWIVGIRHPDDKNRVVTRIPLIDAAFSTSGDYERFFDENGVRYHHILDPRTGHSASKVRSATIIGTSAIQTDGLSKTGFVLGPEQALEIINSITGVDAIFVAPDGRVLYSKGLEPGAGSARQ